MQTYLSQSAIARETGGQHQVLPPLLMTHRAVNRRCDSRCVSRRWAGIVNALVTTCEVAICRRLSATIECCERKRSKPSEVLS